MALLQDVREEARRKGYSHRTALAYAGWVRRFVLFHGRTHPQELGVDEVRAFLVALAMKKRSSSSTRNQALSALRFLYRDVLGDVPPGLEDLSRARRDAVLPVVLSRDEVALVLRHLPPERQLPVRLLYGAGLRLGECLALRLKDLDLDLGRIHIRAGKGRRDRITLLPSSLVGALEGQIAAVRVLHAQDLKLGAGAVELPGQLADRSQQMSRSTSWQWLFPATRRYTDDETGERRRHHLHPTVLQRAVRRAVERSGLLKPATCHTFRHSFATHLVEDGVDIRTVQALLGHADLRTTMIYTHVAMSRFERVRSPVDTLPDDVTVPIARRDALLDGP